MRFQPQPEQLDYAASLRDFLAAQDTPSIARAWAAGDPAPGRALWRKLADQGVLALGLPPEHGGVDATPVDLVLAFEQLGRAAVPGPYVESVAVLPMLLAGTPAADRLEPIGAGSLVATVALPPRVPYAVDAAAADVSFVVTAGGLAYARVTGGRDSVDPSRRLGVVEAGEPLGAVDPAAAFDRGALATAAYLLGAGAALLEQTVDYAKLRRQFGAPIGSFQAVKHQLADVAVALEFARPLLSGAALAVAGPGGPTVGRDVSAAWVACATGAHLAARTALQVHGAIGYTAEHTLSVWLLKVRALLSAWGTHRLHRGRVWAALESEVAGG
ncbi:acyl-CoA dehydrogenase family protein [Pseudofrankia inefficax]|uniref:Acyl-CoA dehydrogenase domain-containing protein n=1 Tax=Pseudofrankia inefficax (strain DSM 45817 / CECT 9037 / DDB 130130 / EuI1c) TaxID=298654 RepID=E3IV89_PSEI1|nr:acyl-CoA dehydrogenase family protein [Pseudofrankia inefficax]ADP81253.1 acyl-CoA dehydrogenase domain-containing protein [Pseudofrankia inefficax]